MDSGGPVLLCKRCPSRGGEAGADRSRQIAVWPGDLGGAIRAVVREKTTA